MTILAENKRAFFNYEILETFEAGLVLTGQEVKSIRLGHIQLAGSYVVIKKEELWLVGATVPPYQPKNAPPDYDPWRPRKLLLQKSEIKYLIGKSSQRGLTFIPLKLYTIRSGKIKLAFAIARGKKEFYKRERIRKRTAEREIQRELKMRG